MDIETIKEVHYIRLNDEERDFLTVYLNGEYDGQFSPYVHDCIKKTRENDTIKTKKEKMNNFFQEVVAFGIGAIFLMFGIDFWLDGRSFLSFIIILCIGIFLVTSSVVDIYLKVRKIKKNATGKKNFFWNK